MPLTPNLSGELYKNWQPLRRKTLLSNTEERRTYRGFIMKLYYNMGNVVSRDYFARNMKMRTKTGQGEPEGREFR